MDVFVLAGQSNMLGSAPMKDLEPARPEVRLFGMDRVWQDAVDPLHRPWRSPEPVHHHPWPEDVRAGIDDTAVELGAGCGIAFANAYVETTGRGVGLIPAAYGGSSMADWAPDRDDGLYGAMLRSVRAAGEPVAGVLWHQGESETGSQAQLDDYVTAMRRLTDAMRRDLGRPDLPVFVAQIGFYPTDRTPGTAALWTGVRLAQLDPAPLGADGVVATVDLTRCDRIHLDTPSQKRLGRRFARLVTGQAQTISFGDVRVVDRGTFGYDDATRSPRSEVRIELRGVTGGWRADGVPSGFSVRDPNGALVPAVWRVDLDGDAVVVHLAGEPVEGAALYYGWGLGDDAHCNITDAVDTALPCLRVAL